MRPGQQQNNKRMRGRNRKGPNPMARVYESNGPDVKIRGTAAHVADKYGSLARDASVSGDPVAAENYLQHAEHYYRIIAAAQAQPQQQPYASHSSHRDDDRDDDDVESNDRFSPPAFFSRAPQNEQNYNQRPNGSDNRPEMNGSSHGAEEQSGGGQEADASAAEGFARGPEEGERHEAASSDDGQGGAPRRGRRRGRYRRKDEGEGGGEAGDPAPSSDVA